MEHPCPEAGECEADELASNQPAEEPGGFGRADDRSKRPAGAVPGDGGDRGAVADESGVELDEERLAEAAEEEAGECLAMEVGELSDIGALQRPDGHVHHVAAAGLTFSQ